MIKTPSWKKYLEDNQVEDVFIKVEISLRSLTSKPN